MGRCNYIWMTGGRPRRCDKEDGHSGIGHSCATDDDYDVMAKLAALESRAAELEAALRALCEAQPGCRAYRDHGSMLSGVTCGAVATVHGPGNSSTFCDEHKAEWMSELPQAQAVRAALLLLAKGG